MEGKGPARESLNLLLISTFSSIVEEKVTTSLVGIRVDSLQLGQGMRFKVTP